MSWKHLTLTSGLLPAPSLVKARPVSPSGKALGRTYVPAGKLSARLTRRKCARRAGRREVLVALG
eukprot:793656-Pelagomonas_calceolata.AAC.2